MPLELWHLQFQIGDAIVLEVSPMITRTTLDLLLALICGAAAAEGVSQGKPPDRSVALFLAESNQNFTWCKGVGGPSPDQQITSCTALIESGSYRGQDLARTYFGRAMGYLRKQDLDRAI